MPFRYAGLRVRDLKRSLRFYTKLLGLREVRRGDLRRYGLGIWVLLQDPRSGQRLELNWYPPRSHHAVAYQVGEALDHLGFLMGKVPRSTLEAQYRRLVKGGARPTPFTLEASNGWVFCVKDPDGIWIEFFRHPTPAESRKAKAELSRTSKRKGKRTSA